MSNNDNRAKFLSEYGKSKEGNFRIIDTLTVPHPYCITSNHLKYSEIYLDEYAIKEAEKHGVKCGICNKTYSEHEKVLLVECDKDFDDGKDELHSFLLSIKDKATKNGYIGFSFIKSSKLN